VGVSLVIDTLRWRMGRVGWIGAIEVMVAAVGWLLDALWTGPVNTH
jgi:hypothetical protein